MHVLTHDKLIRIDELKSIVNISERTIYRMIESNNFPNSVNLKSKINLWRYSEVMEWISSLESQKSEQTI